MQNKLMKAFLVATALASASPTLYASAGVANEIQNLYDQDNTPVTLSRVPGFAAFLSAAHNATVDVDAASRQISSVVLNTDGSDIIGTAFEILNAGHTDAAGKDVTEDFNRGLLGVFSRVGTLTQDLSDMTADLTAAQEEVTRLTPFEADLTAAQAEVARLTAGAGTLINPASAAHQQLVREHGERGAEITRLSTANAGLEARLANILALANTMASTLSQGTIFASIEDAMAYLGGLSLSGSSSSSSPSSSSSSSTVIPSSAPASTPVESSSSSVVPSSAPASTPVESSSSSSVDPIAELNAQIQQARADRRPRVANELMAQLNRLLEAQGSSSSSSTTADSSSSSSVVPSSTCINDC